MIKMKSLFRLSMITLPLTLILLIPGWKTGVISASISSSSSTVVNHMGVINFKNQFLVPFKGHYRISDRIIWKGSKMGYITLNHKVIPAEYDYHVEINYGEGLFFLVKDGKVGLVNENNEVLIHFIFEKPDRIFDEFYAGRYTVFNYGNKMQMIEKGGKLFYPEAPDGLYDAPVKMKEGIGIINGNTLLDIYKNKIETVYLDDNFEKDDFQ